MSCILYQRMSIVEFVFVPIHRFKYNNDIISMINHTLPSIITDYRRVQI